MKKSKVKSLKRYMPFYFMLLPGLIYLIINNYIPVFGLVLAFKKFNYSLGIWKSPFNGIENFKFLLLGSDAKIIFRNTMLYNLAFIVLGTLLSVTVAVLLDSVRSKIKVKIYQTIILIPFLLSIVIVSYMVYAFLSTDNGFINNAIVNSLGGKAISWYSSPRYWPFILIFVYLWKYFGYNSIIYYATIIGIDSSLYEAATLDGAGSWKKILHITLPALKPIIITLTLMSVGRIFYSDFGLFYQVPMDSGALLDVTNTIDTYVYRALLTFNDIGRSSASGFIQSICGFILVLTANGIVKKIDSDNALF